MAEARHVVVAALLAPLVAAGCEAEDSTLLLDRVCRGETLYDSTTGQPLGPPCELSGDAAYATAVSDDTRAVRFGPEGGKLTIHLAALFAASQNHWTLDALATSSQPEGSSIFSSLTWGSCGPACPADPADVGAPLDDSFVWVTLVDDQPGSNGGTIPFDAVVSLRGKAVDLLDLRTPGVPQNTYGGLE